MLRFATLDRVLARVHGLEIAGNAMTDWQNAVMMPALRTAKGGPLHFVITIMSERWFRV
jgi:hypothetical protein